MVALLFSNASQVALIDLNASNYKICLMAMILGYDDDDDEDDDDADDDRADDDHAGDDDADDDDDDDDNIGEQSAVQRKEALQPCEELHIRAALLCFKTHKAAVQCIVSK